MARALPWLFVLACASSGATSANQTHEPEPLAEPEQEPIAEPAEEPVTVTEPTVPTQYFIEREEVDQATFEARFAQLTVEDEPMEAEEVVNEDGSYGGSGATYRARQGETEWLYTVTTFQDMDGSAREARSLSAR